MSDDHRRGGLDWPSETIKMAIEIRAASLGDAEELTRNCFPRNTVQQTLTNLQEMIQLKDRGEGMWLVASVNGEVVGTVTLARDNHRLCRHRVSMGGFVINPSAQGTGLARRLVEAAADWARSLGCEILEIGCRGGTHAENAYKGLGFVEWGRLP